MVSSTFYDLRQIRADLAGFLEKDLGYRPLLSELPTFPIDPDINTVENCRRRVSNEADIFVLVVGGRYGSVDPGSSRSITNLEYLSARTKGIPIYVFVEKRVLAVLPVWEKNPAGDFSTAVDTARLFEFVRDIRSTDKIWMQEFETAQDIIQALRVQFAHLTKEGLKWSSRLKDRIGIEILEQLRGETLELALERPTAWEHRLFGRLLQDEIDAAKGLRRDFDAGITFGAGESLELSGFGSWATLRMAELKRVVAGLMVLMTQESQELAFGPLGRPGDVGEIVHLARKMGTAYREAIEWALRVRRASCDDSLAKARDALAFYSQDVIEKLGAFPSDLLSQVDKALEKIAKGEKPDPIKVTVSLSIRNPEDFLDALDEIKRVHGIL